MPSMPSVLHRTAKPISVSEFYDALRAVSPPRIPDGRPAKHRRIGLAISGGVDSMALAYLCSAIRRTYPWLYVSDSPVSGFSAVVVDHGLRQESAAEARQVVNVLAQLGHRAYVYPLRWRDISRAVSPEILAILDATAKTPDGKRPALAALAAHMPHAVETLARRLRYQALGRRFHYNDIFSLLLAHHEDDQYETLLVRLLSGYGLHGGIRGLRGMQPAADIPECRGLYGIHQSGFVDHQRRRSPYMVMQPTRHQRRRMRSFMMQYRDDEADETVDDGIDSYNRISGNYSDSYSDFVELFGDSDWDRPPSSASRPPPLDVPPLETEDLGIMIYRPLLSFSKDRLIATCEANSIPWFEDHTNQDATLTLRNAVRHLVRRHELPRALQKPAVLHLAAVCNARASQQEAEAQRIMLRHRVLVDFSTNAGTAVIQIPQLMSRPRRFLGPRSLSPRSHSRSSSLQRSHLYRKHTSPFSYDAIYIRKRRLYLRTIAALIIQKALRLVTPEDHVTSVTNLHGVVDTLFPSLAESPYKTADPKGFSICSVHFIPQPNRSTSNKTTNTWYLARAPYPQTHLPSSVATHNPQVPLYTKSQPMDLRKPYFIYYGTSLSKRWGLSPDDWGWTQWSQWYLFDGRFWMRVRHRLPCSVLVKPFCREDTKPFRESLAQAEADRIAEEEYARRMRPAAAYGRIFPASDRPDFAALLKRHAPGKVRYTLPALYVLGDIDWALEGDSYWPACADVAEPAEPTEQDGDDRESGKDGETDATDETDEKRTEDVDSDHFETFENDSKAIRDAKLATQEWERPRRRRPPRLVALPTLGIWMPAIEPWLQCETRYRKIDKTLVEASEVAEM